ncbi:alpha/beta fold hydrolase [Phyllobacterium sp. 21LDTY02-6]|uniref:alpha/beta hydrolase family protein n=1 Tax=Phyllobacterium sp. 21LDTY02-6 TaxID=2944903 RepID=UPI002020B520|nr:alpha/beta fold hydrolase [Phyllobacterium sp. 21LDTY02-6]MCO4316182.1 alpha/beta fold hydrolase [Phyllobacterium sp. 21LDTY02-6]
MEEISFRAADGFELRGSLFKGTGHKPAVLLSSAAAVPETFYRHFAAFLVENGASHVLTYDYRGVAKSSADKKWRSRLNMKDWGALDLPAALQELSAHANGNRIVGIGHSFGGVALGLNDHSARFDRYATVASLSGYYRNTAEPLAVFARMNLVGVPLTFPLGRLPKWSGIGEALPGSIFRDWARWCRNRNFLFEDAKVPEARFFPTVRTPILSIGINDDPWGTPRAIGALMERFENSTIHEIWLSPEAGDKIGHIGFFRKHRADALWAPVANWLLQGDLPAGSCALHRPEAA